MLIREVCLVVYVWLLALQDRLLYAIERWGIGGGSERRRSCGGVQDQWVDRGIERGIVVQWCCTVVLLLLLCQSKAVR
jgi:hypothetical protein